MRTRAQKVRTAKFIATEGSRYPQPSSSRIFSEGTREFLNGRRTALSIERDTPSKTDRTIRDPTPYRPDVVSRTFPDFERSSVSWKRTAPVSILRRVPVSPREGGSFGQQQVRAQEVRRRSVHDPPAREAGESFLPVNGIERAPTQAFGISLVKAGCSTDDRYEQNGATTQQAYFVLKEPNGVVLGRSESYLDRRSMEDGIVRFKEDVPMRRSSTSRTKSPNSFPPAAFGRGTASAFAAPRRSAQSARQEASTPPVLGSQSSVDLRPASVELKAGAAACPRDRSSQN